MKPEVKLLWNTPDADFQILRSARICYNSEDQIDSRWVPTGNAQSVMAGEGIRLDTPMVEVVLGPKDEELLRKLMTNGHNSCLRFASAAFQISGISRVCSHQLVRISHAGILQRSQRYCNEGETKFIFPKELEHTYNGPDGPYMDDVKHLAKQALDLYNEMIEDGVKEEDARYILPAASSTQVNLSGNFQMWKHMMGIRLNKKVQYETRLVASILCRHLHSLAPIIFESDFDKLDKIGL